MNSRGVVNTKAFGDVDTLRGVEHGGQPSRKSRFCRCRRQASLVTHLLMSDHLCEFFLPSTVVSRGGRWLAATFEMSDWSVIGTAKSDEPTQKLIVSDAWRIPMMKEEDESADVRK